jgi:uncharacterized protein
VNSVGINLNTSSAYLLARVAGIGEGLAKAIVDFRNKHGLFKSRKILLEVPRFSTKTFEQAAGFLRVPESDNPLDNTGVHPEQYGVIEEQAQKLGKSVKDLLGEGATTLKDNTDFKEQVGKFTFQDIIRDLEKPGLDPREEFVPFAFREDIMGIKDLKPGMICPGIVTNVTNFGAFVDIGVHQDGLVHISQISDQFIKEPREAVSPGDRVTIRVLEANLEKNQISLSMKLTEEPKAPKRAPREARAPKSPPKRAPLVPSGEPPKVKPRPQGEPPPRQPVAAKRPAGPKQTIAPKAAFNNPFAALSNLKNALKPTGK